MHCVCDLICIVCFVVLAAHGALCFPAEVPIAIYLQRRVIPNYKWLWPTHKLAQISLSNSTKVMLSSHVVIYKIPPDSCGPRCTDHSSSFIMKALLFLFTVGEWHDPKFGSFFWFLRKEFSFISGSNYEPEAEYCLPWQLQFVSDITSKVQSLCRYCHTIEKYCLQGVVSPAMRLFS